VLLIDTKRIRKTCLNDPEWNSSQTNAVSNKGSPPRDAWRRLPFLSERSL